MTDALVRLGDAQNQTLTGSSGQTYVFNWGTNAACRLEAALDRSYEAIEIELRGPCPRVTTIRAYVQAALVTPAHDTVTLEQVGDLIDDLGGWSFVLVGMGSHPETATALNALNQTMREALARLDTQPEHQEGVTH